MRHVIHVVGSEEQFRLAPPRILPGGKESQHETTWYACADQKNPSKFLDDSGSLIVRFLRGIAMGYNFYQHVHGTKLWSGGRPLILVRDRSFSSRVAAYTGTWGGGDVVMPAVGGEKPLGPTRFLLAEDGSLKLHDGQS